MKILDEFYYGNIEPFTRSASYWREIREVSELRERSKEKLLATLTDDQKERFQKYLDCVE